MSGTENYQQSMGKAQGQAGVIPNCAEYRPFDPFNSLEDMKDVFTYHPPTIEQQRQYSSIRAGALVLAEQLMAVPPCADRTAALRLLRECVMTANAAVALRGRI